LSSQGRSPELAASLAQNRPLDGFAGLRPAASQWWRGAVIYQVYVRSFCDSNADGQGDLAGLIGKLDYIAGLGVDAIWLSPIHPSPNRDWGYDISDYENVHPDYGTLADFDALVEQVHARGLKLVLDEVLAHTSDEHAWFAASRDGDDTKSDWPKKNWPKKDWPKKDWYVWADPKDDGTVPNNWLSVFGGPAWSYHPARRQYYHHKFLRQQPKLSWAEPEAREAALKVLDLWLGRGVDGYRLDVANAFLHDAKLTDNPAIPAPQRNFLEWAAAANMQLHYFDSNLMENRALLDVVRRRVENFDDRFVFGEFSEEFERSGCYLPPDKGLHAGYNFALLVTGEAEGIIVHLKTLAAWPDHWPCIAFSNHDVIRTATRFGPGSAKVMLALLFALRGTLLLYQGEELGLTEVDLRRDQLRDPVGDLYYPLFKGRDGCRTPMPWDAAKPNLGFSGGTPWLPLGPDHAALAVSLQGADGNSTLAYARALLKMRKTLPSLIEGDLQLLEASSPEGFEPLIVFIRSEKVRGEKILCLFNLGDEAQAWTLSQPAREIAMGTGGASLKDATVILPPSSAWFGRF
jgi:alpha-glucosidase